MIVRLTHIDGKLPNLALMKLARFYRDRGADIRFTKSIERDMLEPPTYDKVYGSAIFSFSADRVARLRAAFPDAVIGGTHNTADHRTVDDVLGEAVGEAIDYSIYPRFDGSLGFTQRGCRLKCGFCVVPKKEGRARSVSTIADIWRGPPFPKHVHLLDNDFFGQPRDQWEARIAELREGGFKVCFNQGINIRMVDDTTAAAIASVSYYDDGFKERRLYTAWDSLGDEDRFFRGVDALERHGVAPRSIFAYMLVGYDSRETWARVMYRFDKMVARGIRPYPMVFGDRDRGLVLGGSNQNIERRTLGEFQRWVIRKAYVVTPFENYDVNARGRSGREQGSLFDEAAE